MVIRTEGLGKKYLNDWIFRNFNYEFQSSIQYAITGPNGSGKSTLLLVLSGSVLNTEGRIHYQNGVDIEEEDWYNHLVISAPYLDLIEEFTVAELIRFHFQFKSRLSNTSIPEILEDAWLDQAANTYIRHLSSGMKQRLKLALCFFSDVPVILLDEPCTNLDQKGETWYQERVQALKDKLVIICSNRPAEYGHCEKKIDLMELKS